METIYPKGEHTVIFRPTAKEIYEKATLITKELGASYGGKTTDLIYEDQGVRVTHFIIPAIVSIEYMIDEQYRPVFTYKSIFGASRYNYGSWVGKLEEMEKKALQRQQEREDEFFGDLQE